MEELNSDNMGWLYTEGQTANLHCADESGCVDWTGPNHHSYPNRPYHELGPFDRNTLRPSDIDQCINFGIGEYKWWLEDWDDGSADDSADVAKRLYSTHWYNEAPFEGGGPRWVDGCLHEHIEGWEGDPHHSEPTRAMSPFEQQDLLEIGRASCRERV